MTKKEIEEYVMGGLTGEYSHLIIYLDHFDYTYFIRYVKYGEDINEVIKNIKSGGSVGMFSIEEIYNYNLDIDLQLKEKESYHIEPIVDKEVDIEKSKLKGKFIRNITDNFKMALDYAIKKHKGQKRMDGKDYINHPLNVVTNVIKYKESKNMESLLIAAILHDTIEDTDTRYEDISKMFGPLVASLVLELTTDEDMKECLGKTKYLSIKMKNMSSWALVIKLSDRLDNVSDLNLTSNKFKEKYIDETLDILEYIISNRTLSNTHLKLINAILNKINELVINDNKRKERVELLSSVISSSDIEISLDNKLVLA